MKITQKALLFHRATFTFGDKMLDYRLTTEKVCIGFTVFYENIQTKTSTKTMREKFVRYGALTLIIPAIIYCGVFIPLVILGLVTAYFMRFDITILPTSCGNLFLFPGQAQQQILNEITLRRHAEIRRKYAEIDFLNYPQAEIKKFRWLKSEEIISDHELTDAIYQNLR